MSTCIMSIWPYMGCFGSQPTVQLTREGSLVHSHLRLPSPLPSLRLLRLEGNGAALFVHGLIGLSHILCSLWFRT